ncbi:hypothetical protein GGR54DRAFT_517526 [Hypoxylon sp. NC1633]|nr:hypothetical protein GGR54DRAFT_517526 [Hypoxylon sp. NC1633]
MQLSWNKMRHSWNGTWAGRKQNSSNNDQDDLDPNELIPDRKLGDENYNDYFNGDIYDQPVSCYEQEWEIERKMMANMPYLLHIKSISTAWPHLHYLVQWMEVTTSPTKWQLIRGLAPQRLSEIRNERASRTNAAAFDFVSGQPAPTELRITNPRDLADYLDQPIASDTTRFYVVEDLSRDVIELLGSKLDIDPLFFREHINDYTWYNTRDPWVELPDLDTVSRTRPYFRLTYLQPRYFTSQESFRKAKKQAGFFNVLRRLDVDSDHASLFDEDEATVALVRSKASLWIRPASNDQPAIGVLLVDPSIKEGFPLWRGYRPFMNSPSQPSRTPYEAPPRTSLFEDLLFWIRKTPQKDIDAIKDNPKAMGFRILQIICAEWLTLSRYCTARLGQIEWEIERPDFRIEKKSLQAESMNFNTSLQKLHTWRRRLPLYRSMVADTRTKLFPDLNPGASRHEFISELRQDYIIELRKDSTSEMRKDCISELRKDFAIVAGHIDDLLSRTERIAAVATAVTAIEESRRAIEQNKALGRLTYLAVIFAPLSFVSSFFSMSTNVAELSQTIWVYFCVAIPISCLVYLLVDKNWTNNLRSAYDRSAVVKQKIEQLERKF